jgi:hypothetical protein
MLGRQTIVPPRGPSWGESVGLRPFPGVRPSGFGPRSLPGCSSPPWVVWRPTPPVLPRALASSPGVQPRVGRSATRATRPLPPSAPCPPPGHALVPSRRRAVSAPVGSPWLPGDPVPPLGLLPRLSFQASSPPGAPRIPTGSGSSLPLGGGSPPLGSLSPVGVSSPPMGLAPLVRCSLRPWVVGPSLGVWGFGRGLGLGGDGQRAGVCPACGPALRGPQGLAVASPASERVRVTIKGGKADRGRLVDRRWAAPQPPALALGSFQVVIFFWRTHG